MSLISSLVASAVVAAGPATPLPWFTFTDYPMKAFEREWQGVATFGVVVDPNGRPASCSIMLSTGHAPLDRETCYVAMKRARFTPAYGPDGRTTYGLYRSQVVWTRPDRPTIQRDPGPDLEVSVSELPAGTQMPAAVKVAYFIDAAGNPSSCTVLPESAKQPGQLIDAACKQLFDQAPRTAVSANGAVVPAVKTAAVEFKVAK
jgi:TonB family protein